MKSTLKLQRIGAVALAIVGIILNASSIQARPHGGPHCGSYGGGDGERPVQKMIQKLNLSDAQKEQIKALIAQAREKTRPQRELVMNERKKLRELIEADMPDANAIRAQTQKLASYEAELNVVRAEERKKIESILTPEQRSEWKKIRQERKEKMQEHCEKRKERMKERLEKRKSGQE